MNTKVDTFNALKRPVPGCDSCKYKGRLLGEPRQCIHDKWRECKHFMYWGDITDDYYEYFKD